MTYKGTETQRLREYLSKYETPVTRSEPLYFERVSLCLHVSVTMYVDLS